MGVAGCPRAQACDSYDGPNFIGGDATPRSFEGRRGVFLVAIKKEGYWGTAGERKSETSLTI